LKQKLVLATLHRFDDRQRERMRAVHERLDQRLSGLFGDVKHLLGLGGIDADGLFTQHVLAGAQGCDGPVMMQVVGERHVDRVHRRMADQFVICGQCDGNPKPRGEFIGGLRRARANRGEFAAFALEHALAKLPRDIAGPQDSPAQWLAHGGNDKA
jgi:hypothetical protein